MSSKFILNQQAYAARQPMPDKRRTNTAQLRKVMRSAIKQGYDPLNSADAMASAWQRMFKLGNVK